jgi:hypothetical protein
MFAFRKPSPRLSHHATFHLMFASRKPASRFFTSRRTHPDCDCALALSRLLSNGPHFIISIIWLLLVLLLLLLLLVAAPIAATATIVFGIALRQRTLHPH